MKDFTNSDIYAVTGGRDSIPTVEVRVKKTLFLFPVLFSVMVCSAADAGEKSPIYLLLSGVFHPHGPLPPQPPSLPYVPFVPLNDTGITWGGSYPSGNNPGCTGEEIGAQDCSHGRDKTHNDNSDGHAGFSFTKLDANGVPLADQSVDYATTPWACVQDNVTGLIWEVKTNDGGLHDLNDSYTWYNTNPATNGGANGEAFPGGDTCEGYTSGNAATYCNTQAYVARVNAAGWCGKSDWRMPTVKELEGIVSLGDNHAAIDTAYFPDMPFSAVWSGSPLANYSNRAWYVGSYSYSDNRDVNFQVRLVRGGQ
jgi:hypothetical protein